MTTQVAAPVVEPTAPAVADPVSAAPVTPISLTVDPAPVAPLPAPVVEAAPDGVLVEYEPTGDAGLDVALAFVGRLGIDANHPAMLATADGDFSLLEAHLATMGDKAVGWQQMMALAKMAEERSVTATAAAEAAVTAAVHDVVGGDSQWATVQAWASANADPSEKAEINAMFAAGPLQARAAATMLLNAYNTAAGTVVTPASATARPSAGAAQPSNGPLTAREYAQAVQKLAQKIGSHNLNSSHEYDALNQRRLASN